MKIDQNQNENELAMGNADQGKTDIGGVGDSGAPRSYIVHSPTATPQPIRQTLELIWREVLKIDRVDVDDNFFELGGTSFDALVVVSELNRELRTDVSGIALFEKPTIRAMAELLRSKEEIESCRIIQDSKRRGERWRTIGLARRQRDEYR